LPYRGTRTGLRFPAAGTTIPPVLNHPFRVGAGDEATGAGKRVPVPGLLRAGTDIDRVRAGSGEG